MNIKKIWEKAREIPGYPKDNIRQDSCGAWIVFKDYNNSNSPYGWGIDHIFPLALCSLDQIDVVNKNINLRPLHLKNIKSKGNNFPIYQAAVKADGNRNIDYESVFEISNYILSDLKLIGLCL